MSRVGCACTLPGYAQMKCQEKKICNEQELIQLASISCLQNQTERIYRKTLHVYTLIDSISPKAYMVKRQVVISATPIMIQNMNTTTL